MKPSEIYQIPVRPESGYENQLSMAVKKLKFPDK